MGYCISMEIDSVIIPADKVAGCLAAINKMFGPETPEHRSYSWVSPPKGSGFKTLQEAFDSWRYETEVNKEGDITLMYFIGEKLGDDECLFSVIAPFVKASSRDVTIEILGEDGERWRFVFAAGGVVEQHAIISWE